ncbi:MAG: S1C family serine protease [Haloferacaceae archaeon]
MPREPTRRAFLSTVAAVTAGVAGCSAVPPENPSPDERTETTTERPTERPTETPPAPQEVPPDYEAVYRETIDSIGLVRVYGSDSESQGSGFLYDDTHLVTNEHVVVGGDEYRVQFREGDWSEAEVVGTDAYSDLALLKLEDRPAYATPLEFVEEEPSTGSPVLALGAPFGLSQTATGGIISARNRSLTAESGFRVPDSIQTDAAVNPGNSGGPLLDMDGHVVGVVSAGGGDNLGFAVSAGVCRRILPVLRSNGEFDHPYLGVRLTDVTPTIAEANDLDLAQGAMVTDVVEGEAAEGVLQGADDSTTVRGSEVPVGGDVIVAIGGRETRSVARVSQYLILEASPGDVVSVTVLRDGSRTTVDLELGRRPEGD